MIGIRYLFAALMIICSDLSLSADMAFKCHELAVTTASKHALAGEREVLYCRRGTDVFRYFPEQRGWEKLRMYIESDDIFEKIDFRCQSIIGGGENLYCLSNTVVLKYVPAIERWQQMFMRRINI